MKIKETNYLTVLGWMRTRLNLSGNELLVYALIYGFCQDEQSCFDGSISYLCDWIGASKPTILKTLNSLISKQFIIKQEIFKNNVKFCSYRSAPLSFQNLTGGKETLPVVNTNEGGSKETLPGVVKNLNRGGKETLPNIDIYITNNIDNNNIESKLDSFSDYETIEVEEYAYDPFIEFQKWIKENTPDVAKLPRPFTRDQYQEIITLFGENEVYRILEAMDNYKPLLKNNKSAFLTAKKWLEKDKEKGGAPNQSKTFRPGYTGGRVGEIANNLNESLKRL